MIRWLAVNAALTVATAAVAYAVVWAAGAVGLRASGVEPLTAGPYVVVLVSSAALLWPVYMLVVALASRSRRFRLLVLLCAPLLGLFWLAGNLALQVPEVLAADLFYLLYGLVVRPLPRRPEGAVRP